MKPNLVYLSLLLVLAALAPRLFEKQRAERDLTLCKSNLKNLATALEMYASDNGGRYPVRLKELRSSYLKDLPTCPVTGSDYSDTYRSTLAPDSYSFGCRGYHHGTPEPDEGIHGSSFPLGYPWCDTESAI